MLIFTKEHATLFLIIAIVGILILCCPFITIAVWCLYHDYGPAPPPSTRRSARALPRPASRPRCSRASRAGPTSRRSARASRRTRRRTHRGGGAKRRSVQEAWVRRRASFTQPPDGVGRALAKAADPLPGLFCPLCGPTCTPGRRPRRGGARAPSTSPCSRRSAGFRRRRARPRRPPFPPASPAARRARRVPLVLLGEGAREQPLGRGREGRADEDENAQEGELPERLVHPLVVPREERDAHDEQRGRQQQVREERPAEGWYSRILA